MRWLTQWLVPGLRIKRWFALGLLGFLISLAGFSSWLSVKGLAGFSPTVGLVVGLGGLVIVFLAMRSSFYTIFSVLGTPIQSGDMARHFLRRRTQSVGPKVVVLGGGTGLPVVLRGLKPYTANLTAIVTSADDGGSSGRLRTELGILPPGDARNCLIALAETEPLLERLFQYRFGEGEGLEGHAFGNLFIAAMTRVTGDFQDAVKESSRVLAVRGKVLTATTGAVHLVATLQDGRVVTGESVIPQMRQPIRCLSLSPEAPEANAEAVAAIEEADAVIIAPGSLFTSILPVLLVRQVATAIRRTKGICIYVQNLMTQPGETDRLSGEDHVEVLERHVGRDLIDVILVNGTPIAPEVLERYSVDGAQEVLTDRAQLGAKGYQIEEAPLLAQGAFVRHDPERLGRALLSLIVARVRPHDARRRLEFFWLAQTLKGDE